MTNYNTPEEINTALRYLREMLNMTADMELFTGDYEWQGNFEVEVSQLVKCINRSIKAVNAEASGDYRNEMEAQEPAPVVAPIVEEPVVEEPAPVIEEPVVEEPAPIVVQETKEWDADKYTEYFEEYKHLTCENYVMLLNELLEVGDNSDEHLTAVEDLIEEAWGLNCGQDLNDNLGEFEAALKARRRGETLPPVAKTSTTPVEVVSSDDQDEDPTPTEEIDMSIFNGFKWWSDEDHNGKPADIFEFALQIDPNTCTIEEFCHGLLYARVERDNGKEGSLKVDEYVELCSRRAFPNVNWPVNGKGITVKSKAKKLVTPILKDLKDKTDYTKTALRELTKHGYPTHAFYTQAHLTECVNKFDTPADELEGDDLDAMCDAINPEDIEILAPAVSDDDEPEVEEEAKEVSEDQITSAAQRALDFLNR